MSLGESILLGLVQGLTEFLPVSSSGHLSIIQYFFGIEGESVLIYAVLLHLGTLMSIVAVYYQDIGQLILELIAVIRDLITGKGPRVKANDTRILGFMIIVATIPAGIIGVAFHDLFSNSYESLLTIGIGLLFTGSLLWFSERFSTGRKTVHGMRFRDAFLVGIFQSIAITPGISRSGATIVGGLVSGFHRDLAVRFSFLISIPTILGAVVMEAPKAFQSGVSPDLLIPIFVGVVVAAVSGFVAIKTMIRVVSNKKLFLFSYYTWTVGTLVIGYTLLK